LDPVKQAFEISSCFSVGEEEKAAGLGRMKFRSIKPLAGEEEQAPRSYTTTASFGGRRG